jgi:CRISPR-associated endonuclease/helicase Cas3
VSRASISFDAVFQALSGHSPLRWQRRLFDAMSAGEVPGLCELPTGLGKTSVIPIWLIALAAQALRDHISLPRRLAYVVNRRTVVDQATVLVERMRDALRLRAARTAQTLPEPLDALESALRRLAGENATGPLLAVSTLRGELADNGEWKADPARPAIIVGTIDMIGSKLLFSGYGDGRYGRAHHAGLIGHDCLLVHDEAHLTPAFSEMLRSVGRAQASTAGTPSLQVMELSATARAGGNGALTLTDDDERDSVVRERLDASKRLRLHSVGKGKLADRLLELALSHAAAEAKVLVYVRAPETAQNVADRLERAMGKSGPQRVAVLTGTVRGFERDRLVTTDPVYRALLDPAARVTESVYLVSTSAGEVGIDLNADHMVCDATTLDSMIQRLGRVNRRGGPGREARVDVVSEAVSTAEPSPVERAVLATTRQFEAWCTGRPEGLDVSPRAMGRLVGSLSDEDRDGMFAPKPPAMLVTDVVLDAWSLTSITDGLPGRPEVAPYLHGLTRDPPEAHVAWRAEVAPLSTAGASEAALTDWFGACGIEARERLRDRDDRIRKCLGELLGGWEKRQASRDLPVVVLDERGRATWSSLSVVSRKETELGGRTLVLPVEAGGLSAQGMLDPGALCPATEVADAGGVRVRCLVTTRSGEEIERRPLMAPVGGLPTAIPGSMAVQHRVGLSSSPEGADSDESVDLVLLADRAASAMERPDTAGIRQALSQHSVSVAARAASIAQALALPAELREVIVLAAERHDRGKAREIWQRYARNADGDAALAKSDRYLHGRSLAGYRHEFGSVLDAGEDKRLRTHPEADLILHLIAAHHGWARPHFEPSASDRSRTTAECDRAVADAMRRFGRLQQRFGHWGLAWLESLLRCADVIASLDAVQGRPETEREEGSV